MTHHPLLRYNANRLGHWFSLKKQPGSNTGRAREAIMFILGVMAWKIVLDFDYIYFISPQYSYMGMNYDFDITTYVLSFCLAACAIIAVGPTTRGPGDILLQIFLLAGITPFLSFYGCSNSSTVYAFTITAAFSLSCRIVKWKPIGMKVSRIDTAPLLVSILIVLGFSLFFMIYKLGFSKFDLDFFTVYERRRDINESIAGSLLAYVYGITGKGLLPALVVLGLLYRSPLITGIAFVLGVLWFGLTSHKIYAFIPLITLVSAYIYRGRRPWLMMCSALVILVIISIIEAILSDGVINAFVVRRGLFVPAQLSFTYYEVFRDLEPLYFRNTGLLSWLSAYPFSKTPNEIVSLYLFGHDEVAANNGVLGTGFMHGGTLGVFIMLSVVSLLLYFANCLSNSNELWVSAGITTVPFLTLFLNSDLLTTLLTHGLLAALLVLAIVSPAPQKKWTVYPMKFKLQYRASR